MGYAVLLRLLVLIIIAAKPATRVVTTAYAFNAKQLLVRLAGDRERDQVVSGRNNRGLRTAAAAAAATSTLLSGRTEQLLQFLEAARERTRELGRTLFSATPAT